MANKKLKYEISYIGDSSIDNVHHIGIQYDGNYYSIIFGRYANGGFCSIPNWKVGCELASSSDIFWNSESIGEAFENKELGEVIAKVINDFCEMLEEKSDTIC